jgi:hypothetical protein
MKKIKSVIFISISISFIMVVAFPIFSTDTRTKEIATKEIQATILLDLYRLEPALNKKLLIRGYKVFDTDKTGNLYFLEALKHRVLKYSPNGTFIRQIGSIGKDDSGLFYPTAIKVDHENDRIWISDNEGKKIKSFSLSGDYKSSFEIKKARKLNALDTYGDKIYVNTRFAHSKNFNNNSLFSVYNKNGDKMSGGGEIIQCRNVYGYYHFNSNYFAIRDGHLIGAFLNVPKLFHYKITGDKKLKKISEVNLVKIGLPEIQQKDNESRQRGLDSPSAIRSDNGYLEYIRFCNGFDIDKNLHAYYSVLTYNSPPVIYHFDQNARIVEKLLILKKKAQVSIKGIYIDKYNGIRRAIGFTGNPENSLLLIRF